MPEEQVMINYAVQLILFALLNGCGFITLVMGIRIHKINREKNLNQKLFWLYMAAAGWILGFCYMGIMRDVISARCMLRIGFTGNIFWMILYPLCLMDAILEDTVKKTVKRIHLVLCVILVIVLFGMESGHQVRFYSSRHGTAYVGKWDIWSILYGIGILCFFLILCYMVAVQWKRKDSENEDCLLRHLVIIKLLLLAGAVSDFLLPMCGRVSFPAAPLLLTIIMVLIDRRSKTVILAGPDVDMDMASRRIFELVPMPVLIVTRDHKIHSANWYAGNLFGVSPEEMTGASLENYVKNSFFSLKDRFEGEIEKKRVDYEVSVTCLASHTVCGLRYNIVYDENMKCRCAIIIISDMSKQYAMFHKLEASRNRAELANQAKSEFLANMSHEIRTPLNAIMGMDEMIIREVREADILEYAGNIKSAAETMVAMVNDVLDMSKMENGHIEIINIDYDLREMIGHILEAANQRMKNKNLKLECEIKSQMPNYLWGDEVRIRQIIDKLMSNADKFTQEGKIILRVWGEYKDEETINMTVEVEDTGIGIQKEDMEKMFKAFDRVNMRQNRTISGLGLGLSIVKNAVDAMDGEVSVQSEYGKGSIFSFTIPQHVRDQAVVGDFQEWYNSMVVLESGKSARNLLAPGARILAVDDTNVNLEVVKALLKRTKMQVDTASSGEECLKMAAEKKYHIILMDHMMPEMDGIETLQKFKALPNNCSIEAVVIALTANAVAGARDFYLSNGFADYLKKPVKSRSLEEMLVKYLPQELVQMQEQTMKNISSEEWMEQVSFENINLRIGLKYTENNHEMLEGIMKQYMNSGRKHLEEMERCMEDSDWEKYGILVHSLKSTSLNIGAEKLYAHAKMLEAAVHKERMEYIKINHGRMMKLYQSVLKELEDYFAENRELDVHAGIKRLPQIGEEQLLMHMLKLRDKLELSITTEIEQICKDLQQYSFQGSDLKELYKDMFTLVEEYEYDKAIELLEEVLKNYES